METFSAARPLDWSVRDLIAFAKSESMNSGYLSQVAIVEARNPGKVFGLEPKHQSPITALKWRADGRYLLSGSESGEIFLWSRKNYCDEWHVHHILHSASPTAIYRFQWLCPDWANIYTDHKEPKNDYSFRGASASPVEPHTKSDRFVALTRQNEIIAVSGSFHLQDPDAFRVAVTPLPWGDTLGVVADSSISVTTGDDIFVAVKCKRSPEIFGCKLSINGAATFTGWGAFSVAPLPLLPCNGNPKIFGFVPAPDNLCKCVVVCTTETTSRALVFQLTESVAALDPMVANALMDGQPAKQHYSWSLLAQVELSFVTSPLYFEWNNMGECGILGASADGQIVLNVIGIRGDVKLHRSTNLRDENLLYGIESADKDTDQSQLWTVPPKRLKGNLTFAWSPNSAVLCLGGNGGSIAAYASFDGNDAPAMELKMRIEEALDRGISYWDLLACMRSSGHSSTLMLTAIEERWNKLDRNSKDSYRLSVLSLRFQVSCICLEGNQQDFYQTLILLTMCYTVLESYFSSKLETFHDVVLRQEDYSALSIQDVLSKWEVLSILREKNATLSKLFTMCEWASSNVRASLTRIKALVQGEDFPVAAGPASLEQLFPRLHMLYILSVSITGFLTKADGELETWLTSRKETHVVLANLRTMLADAPTVKDALASWSQTRELDECMRSPKIWDMRKWYSHHMTKEAREDMCSASEMSIDRVLFIKIALPSLHAKKYCSTCAGVSLVGTQETFLTAPWMSACICGGQWQRKS